MGSNSSHPETPNQENFFDAMLQMAQCGNGASANDARAENCALEHKNRVMEYTKIWHTEDPQSSHCDVKNKSLECRKAFAKYLNGGKSPATTSVVGGHCSKALGNRLHMDPTFRITAGSQEVTLKVCDLLIRQINSNQ